MNQIANVHLRNRVKYTEEEGKHEIQQRKIEYF